MFFLLLAVSLILMNPGNDTPEKSRNQDSASNVRIIIEQDPIQEFNEPTDRMRGPNNGRSHKPILIKAKKKDVNQPIDLEKRSYENLVMFYEEELRLIAQGERATKVLSSYERGNLLNNGVLKYGNLHWFVSEKAKKYLSEI